MTFCFGGEQAEHDAAQIALARRTGANCDGKVLGEIETFDRRQSHLRDNTPHSGLQAYWRSWRRARHCEQTE